MTTLLQKHPDYRAELERLTETIEYMNSYLQKARERQEIYRKGVKEAFVNLDYLDSSQSYITILVNARHLDNSRESIEKVSRVKDKPYFARIDFIDDRERGAANYYIGKLSLFNENHELLIIDWRSPVAGIYYEGRLGKVSYEAEEGTVTGRLLLKRNYTIEDGELLDFFDMDITTNDEVLQASLRGSADERLKDIVATIQAEQNKIIRANLEQPLIVQGVAGSGKTTIALHRIAYLIYTYEQTFKPENFMIITPNKLFLNYISDVLPELGVEQVEQTTLPDFCFDLLKLNSTLIGAEEKLLALLKAGQEDSGGGAELIEWAAAFKGSLDFKRLLDRYLAAIERDMLPHEDVLLEGHLIMPKEEIERLFTGEFSYMPLVKRQQQIKKKISAKLKQKIKDVLEAVRDQFELKLDKARRSHKEPERANQMVAALIDERDQKIDRIEKTARTLAGSYVKKFKKGNAFSYYCKLITDAQALCSFSPVKLWEDGVCHLCAAAKDYFKEQKLETEDLAPLLYLKLKLEGFDQQVEFKYAVIDEAQNFSMFQFFALQQVLSTQKFTILGDLSQGIHAYRGINDWADVNKQIFNGEATFLTLQQSYRTTVEIMQLANRVLQQGMGENIVTAKPVLRHGSEPEVVSFLSKGELAAAAVGKVKELRREGYSSVAIIGKTMQECQRIQTLFEKNGLSGVPLLTGNEEVYTAGVVIVPAYAAKGLEFDVVIITSLDEPFFINELDTKLLYVAMTRSLHKLFVYEIKGMIAFSDIKH